MGVSHLLPLLTAHSSAAPQGEGGPQGAGTRLPSSQPTLSYGKPTDPETSALCPGSREAPGKPQGVEGSSYLLGHIPTPPPQSSQAGGTEGTEKPAPH